MLQIISVVSTSILPLAFVGIWLTSDERNHSFRSIGISLIAIWMGAQILQITTLSAEELGASYLRTFFLVLIVGIKTYAAIYIGLMYARRRALRFYGIYAYATAREYDSITCFWSMRPEALIRGAAVTLAAIVLTIAAFRFIDVSVSDLVELGQAEDETASFISLVALALIAFSEEIIYRLGIQNWLSSLSSSFEYGRWLGILGSSGLWAIAHSGLIEPDWVKLIQIFSYGIALGWLNDKYGVAICIVSHVTFNISLVLLSGYVEFAPVMIK